MKGYKDKKAKGLITIEVVGDVAYTSEARFDPETGNPVTPILTAVNDAALAGRQAELDEQVADAQSEKEDIGALIVDTDAAKKAKKPK